MIDPTLEMAYCFKENDFEEEQKKKEQEKKRKKQFQKTLSDLQVEEMMSSMRHDKKIDITFEKFKELVPNAKLKDGSLDQKMVRRAILKRLDIDEDELTDNLKKELNKIVSITCDAIERGVFKHWPVTYGDLRDFSFKKMFHSSSYTAVRSLVPNLVLSKTFETALDKLGKKQLIALSKVMKVKPPSTENLSKIKDKIAAVYIVNQISEGKAMKMLEESKQMLKEEEAAKKQNLIRVDSNVGSPWDNLEPFQLTFQQFSELIEKSENGTYDHDDVKVGFLNLLKINESDIDDNRPFLRLSIKAGVNYIHTFMNTPEKMNSIVAQQELTIPFDLQNFAISNPRSGINSKPPIHVTEDYLKRVLKKLSGKELDILASNIGIDFQTTHSTEVIAGKIADFAVTNEVLRVETMRMVWNILDLSENAMKGNQN